MSNNNLRYTGPATIRYSYMNNFMVECPKCFKEAYVSTINPYQNSDAKLECKNCMHKESSTDLIRYKLIVRRNCDNCGKEAETIIPNQKEKVNEITIPCPHCGITRSFKPSNEKYKVVYTNNSKANDPIFNLPLWLQASVKSNLFWAYNKEHLCEIKSYVNSKLRERRTTTHATMVEKLPQFIKDSKNRTLLLKVFERLERK